MPINIEEMRAERERREQERMLAEAKAEREAEVAEQVLECRCGCQSMFHQADGRVLCCNCMTEQDAAHTCWRERVSDPLIDEPSFERAEQAMTAIVGEPQLGRERTVRIAQSLHEKDELSVIIVIRSDGSKFQWAGVEKEWQKGWVAEKVLASARVLAGLDNVKQELEKMIKPATEENTDGE